MAGISPVLRVLRFEVESSSELPSEICARIALMSGVEPDASEDESESDESEDPDEEISVDESDESDDPSPKTPSCDASVVLGGRSWTGSLLQCTHTM